MNEMWMFDKDFFTPLLICPYCVNNIPSLDLKPSKGQMDVALRCSCFEGSREVSLSHFMASLSELFDKRPRCADHPNEPNHARGYCPQCNTWRCISPLEMVCFHHKNFNRPRLAYHTLTIQCNQHNKRFSHYCKGCQVNCCDDCKEKHKKHQLIKLVSIQFLSLPWDVFNVFFENNREITEMLITQSDFSSQMKKDLKAACDANEKINRDLEQLHETLCASFKIYEDITCYELMKLHSIVLNVNRYTTDCQTIEEEYVLFKEFLLTQYIMTTVPLIESCSTLIKLDDSISVLCLLEDGRLAVAFVNGDIHLWNTSTNECIASLKEHRDKVSSLIQLTNRLLVSGSSDSSIKLWNVSTHECIATLRGHRLQVTCLLQLWNGDLASGSYDKTIQIWSTSTNNELLATLTSKAGVTCLSLLNDGRLVTILKNNSISLWNSSTYKYNDTVLKASFPIQCVSLLNDDRLAYGTDEGVVNLLKKYPKMQYVTQLIGHKMLIYCIIQLRDGRIVSASGDCTIRLWSLKTDKCTALLIGNCDAVTTLLELDDGRLVSGSKDETIRIWNLPSDN